MKRSFWIGMWVHLAIALAMMIAGIALIVQGVVYGPLICLAGVIYVCVGIYMYGFAYYFANKDKK